tara:strand:- start:967 stop:2274 length:1308 start_codon:yes stop_codon:yes gene_type:complete
MARFFHKFKKNDVYVNTIKTYPEVKFTITGGAASYNDTPSISGSLTSSLNLLSSGGISLYELNVDRQESSSADPDADPTPQNFGPNNVVNNKLIRPWVSKDGMRIGFRTTSKASFNSTSPGDIMYSSYPLSASIKKTYYDSTTARYTAATFDKTSGTGIAVSSQASVTRLLALKNTINYYNYVNPEFTYSNTSRDFDSIDLGLISIPSIFYGNNIKKGTIDLKFFFTGTLVARAQDTAQNGLLYETTGPRTGGVIGLVLYNEGILILTGAYDLAPDGGTDPVPDTCEDTYEGGATNYDPKWVYFGAGAQQAGVSPVYSSFTMEMSGTEAIQSLTMFAKLPKGQLNHSNNPTYLQFSTASHVLTGSSAYLQDRKRAIKNIVSSSYNDPTGSFEKTTYVSKIGIYDENENLIAIAKPATPVRKTAARDFTFKLKLDI